MGISISTREAYGDELVELGKQNKSVFALDADVSSCTKSCGLASRFPERFCNAGIAEANMVGIAAGMTTLGYIPFVHSFAMFSAGRCFDQIRNSLAYPDLNVKVVGTHAGLSVGEDGATHQCLEDLGIMRTIPNMTIVCPCDGNETAAAVKALAALSGPCYLRLGRAKLDTVTDLPGYSFEIGRGVTLRDGGDITVIAIGMMVQAAVEAADRLSDEGLSVRVINMHTLKPLDKEIVLKAAKETGAIVTAEEHNVMGGLGSAVSELLCEEYPAPVHKIGTQDVFGRSGDVEKLMDLYGLTSHHIAGRIRKVCKP